MFWHSQENKFIALPYMNYGNISKMLDQPWKLQDFYKFLFLIISILYNPLKVKG